MRAGNPLDFFQLIWLLFLVAAFLPGLRQRQVVRARLRKIAEIEERRGSRVITLIHRQESMSFLGFLFQRFINIEDSEQILRAIRFTPDTLPIDLVLHTPGGLVLASEQIARAILRHPARVTVFVPHYAMSGGTLIALAADTIVMDENAVLGPVDPQLGRFPANSILRAVEQKSRDKVDDETLIFADVAAKAVRQMRDVVREVLVQKMPEADAARIAEALTSGQWTHDFPLTCEHLRELGITVECNIPQEIYELMELYPQAADRRPSVQFVPVPYREPLPERGRGWS